MKIIDGELISNSLVCLPFHSNLYDYLEGTI